MFSPGVRTPPPESMSRWNYHVSCPFQTRHSHTRQRDFYFSVPCILPPSHPSQLLSILNDFANFFLTSGCENRKRVISTYFLVVVNYFAALFEHRAWFFTFGFSRFSSVRSVPLISFILSSAVTVNFFKPVYTRLFDKLTVNCTFTHVLS